MELIDFSQGFDTLLNSYAVAAGFGSTDNPVSIELDEYEKSLLLTQAQEDFIISLYNGKNSSGDSFEATEEMRRYLSNLIKEASLSPITTTSGAPLGVESNSKFFTLPDDLWFITYESVSVSDGKCENESSLDVYPVRQDEYRKLRKNPFRGANDRRALRLDLADNVVEVVSKYTVGSYYVRYLKKLSPIILEDLPDGMTINGVGTATNCMLHDALHQKILELAVQTAIQTRGYVRNNNRE
jgi:hypothetical protein